MEGDRERNVEKWREQGINKCILYTINGTHLFEDKCGVITNWTGTI